MFNINNKLYFWQVHLDRQKYVVNPKPYMYRIHHKIKTPIKRVGHETNYRVNQPLSQDFYTWKDTFIKDKLITDKAIAVSYDTTNHILINVDITNNLVNKFSHPDLIQYTYCQVGDEIRKIVGSKYIIIPYSNEDWYKEQMSIFYSEARY